MLTDIEDGKKDVTKFHLAGIIPVAGEKLDFKFPWHDCMMPVGENILAIEQAILQCTYAGCETIWIVGYMGSQPLIRKRVGDSILDPNRILNLPNAYNLMKEISIYYVPIHPKDRDRRDCLAWSVIYGALRAFHISKTISSWVVPDKYFVSFPYGLLSTQSIFNSRSLISSTKNFYMSYGGKTIKDGEYLPFTFDKEDFKKFRRVIREGTGKYRNVVFDKETNRRIEAERIPTNEQYSARFFSLDKVFGCATLEGNNLAETEWYFSVDSWDKYLNFLSSEQAKKLKRPKYFKYHEWNPVGVDKEDIGE